MKYLALRSGLVLSVALSLGGCSDAASTEPDSDTAQAQAQTVDPSVLNRRRGIDDVAGRCEAFLDELLCLFHRAGEGELPR